MQENTLKKEKKIDVSKRLASAKIVFAFCTLFFFLVYFFVGAGFYDDIFSPYLSTFYTFFLFSFFLYLLLFLMNLKEKKKGGIVFVGLIIILVIVFIFLFLPLFIKRGEI